jgi:hypothetical protein
VPLDAANEGCEKYIPWLVLELPVTVTFTLLPGCLAVKFIALPDGLALTGQPVVEFTELARADATDEILLFPVCEYGALGLVEHPGIVSVTDPESYTVV